MSNGNFLNLARLAFAVVAAIHSAVGAAQVWPERAVRIVIPFPAGTGVDVAARLIADKLTQRLGKSFVADNRPGANGIIGTEIVAKSAPDGYTLLAGGNTTHAANPNLYKTLPYDSLKDFAPVAYMVGLDYYLVVGTAFPARNVQELITYAKANPGKLSYATGNATSTIAAEMFKLATGTDFVQVNYKGNPLAATDVIGGTVTTMFLDTSTARPLLQAGKLRALAIAAARRSDILPEVPTTTEAGLPGLKIAGWNAVWFPAKTPRTIVERLNAEVNAARAMPDVVQALKELGLTLEGSGPRPEDFGEFVKNEIALWARVVKDARIPRQ